MVQRRSKRRVIDNTGIRKRRCIGRKHGTGKHGKLGATILASVKQVRPNTKWQKGMKVRAVVARTKKETRRRGGIWMRSPDNGAVLRNKSGSPMSNRVFGVVPRTLRANGFGKVVSRAEYVV